MLHITVLGPFQVSFESVPELKLTGTIRRLFAYLLLQNYRPQPRELLAELFWGDQSEERAHKCLNTALWRLRTVLELEGIHKDAYLVNPHPGEIAFNRESQHWLDLVVFEETARRLLSKSVDEISSSDEQDFQRLQQLYRGDLLESFYDDWALRAREYIRKLYLDSLSVYMGYEQRHGHLSAAIEKGLQILDMDPLREEIHRDVMRLYLTLGQRTLAIRQYQICADLLERELGILPLSETQQLYALCLEDSPATSVSTVSAELSNLVVSPSPKGLTDVEEMRKQLEHLNRTLNSAQRQLDIVKQHVQNLQEIYRRKDSTAS